MPWGSNDDAFLGPFTGVRPVQRGSKRSISQKLCVKTPNSFNKILQKTNQSQQ